MLARAGLGSGAMAGVAAGADCRGPLELDGPPVADSNSGTLFGTGAERMAGANDPCRGMTVAEQAGKGVISVGVSVADTLLAVTVTS